VSIHKTPSPFLIICQAAMISHDIPPYPSVLGHITSTRLFPIHTIRRQKAIRQFWRVQAGRRDVVIAGHGSPGV
jgi:hypothetical protein